MSKAKEKHGNKGATGATHTNLLNYRDKMLHPCIFKEVTTKVQQVATKRLKTYLQRLKDLFQCILQECCMLHPY